jgi:hypothetical protein
MALVITNVTTFVPSPAGGGETQKRVLAWDSLDYVNGGITFAFPAGTFAATPKISVSIRLKNLAYSAATSLSHAIEAASATAVTIRVNKGTIVSIIEAATDDVTVEIHACGAPG